MLIKFIQSVEELGIALHELHHLQQWTLVVLRELAGDVVVAEVLADDV